MPLLATLALAYLVAMVVSGAMPVQRQLVRFEPKGVLKMAPERIARVEMSRGTQRLTLLRTGDQQWTTVDGTDIGPAGSRVSMAVQMMHTSGPVREMAGAELVGVDTTPFGLDPPQLAATLYNDGGRARPHRALRRAQSRGVSPVHAPRRRRAALPDVALRRRGMEPGNERGDGKVRWSTNPFAALKLLGLIALGLVWGGTAPAHVGGTMGYATVSLHGGTVRLSLTLGIDALGAATGADPSRPSYDALAGLVAQKVAIFADGNKCEPVPFAVTPPSPDRASIVIVVDYACPDKPRELRMRDNLSDALGPDYHTLANIEAAGGARQFVLEPDQREARVAVAASADRAPAGGGLPSIRPQAAWSRSSGSASNISSPVSTICSSCLRSFWAAAGSSRCSPSSAPSPWRTASRWPWQCSTWCRCRPGWSSQ